MINKDKTILVTGADGFIGSHLVEMLHENGFKVRALAQYNSFNNWGWLEDINCQKDIEIIAGDIRDPFFCQKLCEDVDTIFHLAALIAIPYSYVAPQSSGGDRDQNRALKELLDSSNLKSNRSVGWDSAVGNTGGKVSHNNI